MRRRELLTAGVGGIAATSGCSRRLMAETVTIEKAIIVNFDDSSGHEVYFRLANHTDVVYEGTHQLGRLRGTVAPSATVRDELPDESGRYTATARLDESDSPSELNVAEHARTECAVLQVAAFDTGLGITTMDRCEERLRRGPRG